MDRKTYMKELAYLLQDMSEEEREEALQYYEDYFEDAGPEKEAEVIAELGSLERLAAMIRAGVNGGFEEQETEYTEHGVEHDRYKMPGGELVPPEMVQRKQIGTEGNGGRESGFGETPEHGRNVETEEYAGTGGSETFGQDNTEAGRKRRKHRNPIVVFLMLCGLIIAVPVDFGLFCLAGGISLVILCTAGGILLAVIISAAAFLFSGVVLVGVGIGKLFTVPAAGMMIGGGGFVLLAVGLLALLLSVWFCGKAIPALIHMIGNLFGFFGRRLRRGGQAA